MLVQLIKLYNLNMGAGFLEKQTSSNAGWGRMLGAELYITRGFTETHRHR
jgi:hypothetical protein